MSRSGTDFTGTIDEAFQFRPVRIGDEPGIVELLEFPGTRACAVERWNWKLSCWPSRADSVWIATHHGSIVFHYGGIPLPYMVDGEPEVVMISVDARTAPEFRRRGLLTEGVRQAFGNWRENEIAFTLGLPNEQWGSRQAALGWRRLFPLAWLVRPVRPERVAAQRLRQPWLQRLTFASRVWRRLPSMRLVQDSSLDFERVREADDRFDELWARRLTQQRFSAVRDKAWVQWRFLSVPDRDYTVTLVTRSCDPVGYSACRIHKSANLTTAFIAEIVAADSALANRNGMLAAQIAYCEEQSVDLIATLAVPGTRNYQLFRRSGFLPGPAFNVCLVPFRDGLDMSALCIPDNWDISGADFDVI